MADRCASLDLAACGKKRKAFDIPALSELEEVIKVTPVFNRLKKTQKQVTVPKFCTNGTNSEVSKTKQLRTAEQSNEEYVTPDIDISSGLKSTDCEETMEKNKLSKKDERDTVFVGKNFQETFAFIEKTKYYQPQPSKVKSDISETITSTSLSNAGQDTAIKSSKPNAIIVNQRQKGNPILKFFRNVAWEYGDVVPDYVMGPRMCALFLSIRYHNFNPNYIHERLKQLGSCYELRVLLVQVDIKDPHKSLKELTKMAILADCTLILAWSAEEAARYLEMYKIYENKPPEVLQGQINTDYLSKLTDCLTTVKSVNKTDTVTLLSTFESLENIISASKDDITLCPGFGPQKAKRLHDAFHQSFIASKKASEQDPSGNFK